MKKFLAILMLGVLSACTSPTAPVPTPGSPQPPTETPRPGNQIVKWPPQSGYIKNPSHKPSSIISEATANTDWEIWGITEGNIEAYGDIEYSNSRSLAYAFGARITNRNRLATPVTIKDYNGDECIIPYGMTVEVDAYGQFQPYWYDPELAPVPSDTPTATAESSSELGADTNLQQQSECARLDLSVEESANCGEHQYVFTGKIVDEYGGYNCYYDDIAGTKTAEGTEHLLVDFSVKDSLTMQGFSSWDFSETGESWERINQNHYSQKQESGDLIVAFNISFTATGFVLDFSMAQTDVCKDGPKCGCTYHEEYNLIK